MVATFDPAVAASYQNAANAFKAAKWGPNGTVNGLTGAQNLAAVLQQPGNTQINNPSNQAILAQAAKDSAPQQQPTPQVQQVQQPQPQQPQQQQQQTMSNGNTDLINSMYNNNYASQLQKLQETRQIQQQGLNQQETGVNQNALQNLNNNDALANSQLKQLQEVQANNGVRGGDSITATIGNQTAQQNGANSINQDKANQLNDIQQKRSLINNNASANDLALMQQLQATRSGQLIDNNNTQDQRAIQLAQLMGTYNGQQTLGGQQQALAAQGQKFNQGVETAGLTGSYNGAPTMAAQGQLFNQGIAQAGLTGQYNGQTTLAGQNAALNNTQVMAQLTGKMPDGTPTNAAQQQQLANQWTVAEQTGTIPNSLADFYGLPHGMQTQAAKTQAAQIAISNRNASNAERSTTASINNMNADNTRQDNAVKSAADQQDYTSKVYNELSQLDPADAASYLSKNSADIVKNLGQKGYDALKSSATSGQAGNDKATADAAKAALDVRDKAIAAAQKVYNFDSLPIDQQKALIQQYETLYK